MIKKLVAFLAALATAASCVAFSALADEEIVEEPAIITPDPNGAIMVYIDGERVEFDVEPQIVNDRTVVPMRAIFEALGAEVEWTQETKTITSTAGDVKIVMQIDNTTMTVNDEEVTLDTAPFVAEGDRTLVPVRAISEAFKCYVDWDGSIKLVSITSNGAEVTPTEEPAQTVEPEETTAPTVEPTVAPTVAPVSNEVVFVDSEEWTVDQLEAAETVKSFFLAFADADLEKMNDYCTSNNQYDDTDSVFGWTKINPTTISIAESADQTDDVIYIRVEWTGKSDGIVVPSDGTEEQPYGCFVNMVKVDGNWLIDGFATGL